MSNKTCRRCGVAKPLALFAKDKRNLNGVGSWCLACHAAYRSEHKDRLAAYYKRYRKEKIESCREKEKSWRERNREHYLRSMQDYSKNYYLRNKERLKPIRKAWTASTAADRAHLVAAYAAARRTRESNATPPWADHAAIQARYRFAKVLTELTGTVWHVDHIVPLRGRLVCGLHCEANLQVLPAADNIKKGNRIWPDMP